jgi:tetratricopeptide (TPR) repeat protein
MKRYKLFLLLFAFAGFLWSCESTSPLVNEVQLSLVTGNYDAALETVNTAIEADPNNHIAHFYKGVVLSSQAESFEDPRERKEYYAMAKESYDTARSLMEEMEEAPAELEELNGTVVTYWADEYNMAVNIQNDDSLFNATEDPYRTSLAHLENAVTINPDSAMTYQVLSSTHFQLEQIDQAISTYEEAMQRLDEPETSDYEYLTSLYLYDNQYEKAISMAEDALERDPGNSMFVQFMADAYIQSGNRDKAVEIVQNLINEEPDNPQYRRVLGTQIYQNVEELGREVSEMYEEQFELRQEVRGMSGDERADAESRIEELGQEIDEIEANIDELTQISAEQMKKVVELEPESESANFILGIIYQNRAANLFERRNNTTDNAQANEYDDMARDVLQNALTYYERAAEINPDNPDNWQSLFQVYTTLGMEEEAAEAMEKAGFEN